MATKLSEHTNGNHIYMRLMLDNKRIEEIDVYLQQDGTEKYVTSADHGMELDLIGKTALRDEIIKAFKELY